MNPRKIVDPDNFPISSCAYNLSRDDHKFALCPTMPKEQRRLANSTFLPYDARPKVMALSIVFIAFLLIFGFCLF